MASTLVTLNKAQKAAYRRVDVTLSALQTGKPRQRMMTCPAQCVQLEPVSPNAQLQGSPIKAHFTQEEMKLQR